MFDSLLCTLFFFLSFSKNCTLKNLLMKISKILDIQQSDHNPIHVCVCKILWIKSWLDGCADISLDIFPFASSPQYFPSTFYVLFTLSFQIFQTLGKYFQWAFNYPKKGEIKRRGVKRSKTFRETLQESEIDGSDSQTHASWPLISLSWTVSVKVFMCYTNILRQAAAKTGRGHGVRAPVHLLNLLKALYPVLYRRNSHLEF